MLHKCANFNFIPQQILDLMGRKQDGHV